MLKTLKTAVLNFTDNPIYERGNRTYEHKSSTEWSLLDLLAQKLNFRYEIFIPEDNLWGHKMDDGHWTGIMGMLSRKEIDFGIQNMRITSERFDVVDYAFPYLVEQEVFCTRAAATIPREFAFIYPFELSVWISVALSILVSSWMLSFFHYCDPQGRTNKNFSSVFLSWGKYFERIVELFLGQGGHNKAKKQIIRIFISFWSLSTAVLLFSYSGVLLSFLMIPLKEPLIRSNEELRDAVVRGKIRFGTFDGSSQLSDLLNAKQGTLKDLGDHLRKHPEDNIDNDNAEIIRRIRAGHYAFYTSRVYQETMNHEAGHEDFFFPNDIFEISLVTVLFRKDFCCIPQFSQVILRVIEAGLYNKWVRDKLFELDLKAPKKKEVDPVRALVLTDIFGALMILVSGYALSFIVLLGERKAGKNARVQGAPISRQTKRY